jgi:hypothetical protein
MEWMEGLGPFLEADCGDLRGIVGDVRRSRSLSQADLGEGWELISNLVLGVNCDNRDSVHGRMKVAWRRTLGWMNSELHTLELVKPIPAEAGWSEAAVGLKFWRTAKDERPTTASVRTIFDNWIDWAIYKAVNFYECLERKTLLVYAARISSELFCSPEVKIERL